MKFFIIITIFAVFLSLFFTHVTVLSVGIILVYLRFIMLADSDAILFFLEKFGASPASKLKDKVVWITGASRGIGAALSVEFARCGCKVVLSARDEFKLNEIKEECLRVGATSNNILVLPLDLLQLDKFEAALETVLQSFSNKLDILVSNAGRSQRARWDAIELEVDKSLFELNVFSLVALARLVNRHFVKHGGGHHVVTSSSAGKLGAPRSASYTASKHALHGYFESLRLEGAPENITVTMLCPGPVQSDLMKSVFTERLNQPLGLEREGNRMSAKRCAQLSVTAVSHKLPEAWICNQPVLALHYIVQYCPLLPQLLLRYVNLKIVMKIRDGRADAVPENN